MAIYFNGFETIPENRQMTDITSPATGKVLAKWAKAIEGDGEQILRIARDGFKKWSSMHLHERAKCLLKYADLLVSHSDEVALTECHDMGKLLSECQGETLGSAEITKGYVERAKHLYGEVISDLQPGTDKDIIFTRREPIGVFLCIIPFNFPVELFTHKVIPALIMGNSVIVKVPSENPLPLYKMTELLVEAGVPKEAITLIYADRTFVTEEIIKSDQIDGISLTGSTATGIDVLSNSAKQLHKTFMELGGNDALIVTEGANLEYAVDELIASRLLNAGQTCCATKRVLVHENIEKEFIRLLLEKIQGYKFGNPEDPNTRMGCVVSAKAAKQIIKQVELTVQQGATCICGGKLAADAYVEPTVLVNVTRNMDVAKDMEIFGPVIPIIRYHSIEEAVEIANQSVYGLEASIISDKPYEAIALAARLQAGTIVINGAGTYRHMDMPFGGYKQSGIGRQGIMVTLEEFSQVKSYVLKRALDS